MPTTGTVTGEGLTAFPLTPLGPDGVDHGAFTHLVTRLAAAGVDAIGALGSTGNYAYLTRRQRALAARIAVQAAGHVPVIVSVGATSTEAVLELVEDAQNAGVAGVLLAPVSYQPLTQDEVHGLYRDVAAHLSVPLCVYDNPTTTGFTFSDELLGRIAHLPGVASVKIAPVPSDVDQARRRVARLRALVPAGVSIGASGDATALPALEGGCRGWYSVSAGLLPEGALAITRAAQAGDHVRARELGGSLQPLWSLFTRYGSLRVVCAAAELLGLTSHPGLPRPLLPLSATARDEVSAALKAADEGEHVVLPRLTRGSAAER